MINLLKNELIKIFKRKSIYFLFIVSIISIIIYNYLNPDQNIIVTEKTEDMNYINVQNETIKNNVESYIYSLAYNDFAEMYNNLFDENSWQRYALNKERNGYSYEIIYDQDIMEYLINIKDYEYNKNTQVTEKTYEISKSKYNQYIDVLKSNDWKKFVELKIKNLEEKKNTQTFSVEELKEINFEIDWYHLRLNNDINYGNTILNYYLNEYREDYYIIIYKESYIENKAQFDVRELNEYKARLELNKYAIENHIEYDISNEENLIINNKVDARIAFIRTFNHFNIILIIITIYISSTIITEEINKKTIKNMLIKPHRRISIIISKVLACMITIALSMFIISIVQFLVGGFIFGFESYSNRYIGYDMNNNKIFNINLLTYIIISGISKIPEYIIISLFCILIGLFNKNITMSMILTLIICLFANTVLVEWSKVDSLSNVTRFFITNNWDFSIYMFGNASYVNGLNLWNSIFIYGIYFILLLKLVVYKFKKIEI